MSWVGELNIQLQDEFVKDLDDFIDTVNMYKYYNRPVNVNENNIIAYKYGVLLGMVKAERSIFGTDILGKMLEDVVDSSVISQEESS